ncbi:unnamed protein product [Tuber aestivum]|uniref:Allantoicase domain-containing protein n=1 Tax=Tuber aestivum TaxID=59557 RepID=A0A292Q0J2_9PEZI|nr:unnamed protein product [Tuber aestivum]
MGRNPPNAEVWPFPETHLEAKLSHCQSLFACPAPCFPMEELPTSACLELQSPCYPEIRTRLLTLLRSPLAVWQSPTATKTLEKKRPICYFSEEVRNAGNGRETNRSHKPGYVDLVILKLLLRAPGYIEEVIVDALHFRGNYSQAIEIYAINSSGQRIAEMAVDRNLSFLHTLVGRITNLHSSPPSSRTLKEERLLMLKWSSSPAEG